MNGSRISAVRVVLFLALAGLAPNAHAYLDPSTGSMILSAIVGIFATLGLTVKTYWYKVKRLISSRGSRHRVSAEDTPDELPDSGRQNQPHDHSVDSSGDQMNPGSRRS